MDSKAYVWRERPSLSHVAPQPFHHRVYLRAEWTAVFSVLYRAPACTTTARLCLNFQATHRDRHVLPALFLPHHLVLLK